LSELNWLAVLTAAVAWFVLGGIWYARPVMGRAWMRSLGMEPPAAGYRPSPMMFVWTFVAYLLTTIAVALLVAFTATDDVGDALVLGVVLGVGFFVAGATVAALYEQKARPWSYVFINGIFGIAAMVLVTVILALWP
jgi:hypothetical protein